MSSRSPGKLKSPASVASSLKAFATSLGIKRVVSKSSYSEDADRGSINSKEQDPSSFSPGKFFSGRARDSLADHATPYSQLPPSDSLPDTDHFKFSTPDASILGDDDDDGEHAPVPGTSTRAGRPAPPGARLSLGAGQSTIRLVTHTSTTRVENPYLMSPPRLAPIQPDFDIKMGTPSAGRILSVWPASPRTAGADASEGRLYPKLPLGDLRAARDTAGDSDEDGAPMPGGIFASAATPAKTPARNRTTTATTTSTVTPRTTNTPGPLDEPDMFSPAKPSAAPTSNTNATATVVPPSGGERMHIPRSAPFLFGSPLPRRETPKAGSNKEDSGAGVSNIAFEGAAKSVLEEMQRRLAEAQKERELNGEAKPAPSTAPAFGGDSIFGGLLFGAGGSTNTAATADRYAKMHEAEFAKMDSIANHYAARRPAGAANGRKRKSEALGAGARAWQKRRSSAAGTRVISNGARKKRALPGGFGADEEEQESDGVEEEEKAEEREEEEEDVGARRSSKRMRINEGWDVHRGQRVSIVPPLPPAEEEKKLRERDAVKRELDAAKARRRSSRGRASMGGKNAPPAKGKASRFGFLSSAKSIVKNVWNLGAGGKTKAAVGANAQPSSIPVPKAAPAAPAVAQPKAADAQKLGHGLAPKAANSSSALQNGRKLSGTHSRIPSVSSTSGKLLKPVVPASSSATDPKTTGTIASTRSSTSRARSPIPSFAGPSAAGKASAPAASRPSSIAGTARSRMSSTGGTTTSSRQASRTSTVSSMGTRSTLASGTSSTAVSSMGTRRSTASTTTLASTTSKTGDSTDQQSTRKRTSSLLAPTASSLAKMNTARPSASGRTSGLPAVSENEKRTTGIPGLFKSPMSSRTSPLSPPGRIFSQPLTNFGSPRSNASPAPHPSLGAAATTLFGAVEDSSPSKIPRPAVLPPKPKTLVARKPRISRSRVIAKVGAQRAAAAQASASSPNARTRSSFGARRSFGGVKSGRASGGAEVMRNAAKKRARQSEYMRRKSRAGASESENA
ncbi:hypothetical protein C2E23DRAFT_255652 [Lenzites betulinus]|nr:hypothetical protein C2E23DRAFT_255652 [Lenzites betulinus]